MRMLLFGFACAFGMTISSCAGAQHERSARDGAERGGADSLALRTLVRAYVTDWRMEVVTSRRGVRELMGGNLPLRTGGTADGSIEAQLADGRVFCLADTGWYLLRFDIRVRDRIARTRLLGLSEPGYCPFWDWALAAPPSVDGTSSIVPLLPAAAQERLAARRDRLLNALDAVLERNPRDSAALGQRVRFSTSVQARHDAAQRVARCGDTPYCLQLAAQLQARGGDLRVADSLFAHARAQRNVTGVCRDDGLDAVWPRGLAPLTEQLSCGARSRHWEALWWLANPRWSDPVNTRRLTHELRVLDVLLRDQVGLDEYLDFARNQRVTAEALVLRYGFPRRILAFTPGADTSYHFNIIQRGDAPYRVLGAPQYTRDYYRTIPTGDALANPFDATLADFAVRAPPPQFDLRAEFPEELIDAKPQLHDLPSAQLAHFLRDSLMVLAVAVPPPPPSIASGNTRAWQASLIASPGPGTTDIIATARADSTAAFRLLGLTTLTPSVMSVEVEPALQPADDVWRARFGQRPPPALLAATGGALALSDLLLLDPSADSLGSGLTLEQAARQMLTSSVLTANQRRLGLFWELYGISADAPAETSVRYTITVTSSAGASVLSRVFALARGQSTASSDGVAMSLVQRIDPRATARTQRGAAVVPHGLVLNLADLPAGDYAISVAAATIGAASAPVRRAEARRAIRLIRQ